VLALMLGLDLDDAAPGERFEASAARAFESFEHLQRVAATVRTQHSADHHELSAVMSTKGRITRTGRRSLAGIVDRIGSGDAFAAGLLHGLISGYEDEATLEFALAAACLKHAIPGDFNLATVHDVESVIADRSWDVRR